MDFRKKICRPGDRKELPSINALHKRRVARPAVVKAFGDRAKAMEEIIERNSQ